MSKKKRFGISEDTTVGLAQTIALVENNPGKFRNTTIPLSNIVIDPDNPRELALEQVDIEAGISASDPKRVQKLRELDGIEKLASSIKKDALLQPIIVYKNGEKYQIVAGERRYLASILAKNNNIEARVYINKPNLLELKCAQWVENNQRQDLNLNDRINNVRELIITYEQQNGEICSATVLTKITGLSLSQASAYMNLLKASPYVKKAIQAGELENIHKALVINNLKDDDMRAQVLQMSKQGASLSEIKKYIKAQADVTPVEKRVTKTKLGRRASSVKLGSTKNIHVVEKVLQVFAEHPNYKSKVSPLLTDVEGLDYSRAGEVFAKFVKMLESDA